MNSPFSLLNGSVHTLLLATTILFFFFNNPIVVVLARPQDAFEMRLAEVSERKPISQEEQIAKWKSLIGSTCSWQTVRFFFLLLFIVGPAKAPSAPPSFLKKNGSQCGVEHYLFIQYIYFFSLMVGIGLLQLPATSRRQKENAYVRCISRSSVKTPDLLLPSFNAVYRPLAQTRISLPDRPVWTRQKATSVLTAPVDLSRKSFFPYIS